MKQLNNKILLLVLVVLVGGFVLTRLFRSPARESSLKENLVTIDTASVTEVHVSPAVSRGEEIKLVRSGGSWQVRQAQRTAEAERALIKNALGALEAVRPERIMTRKKEKWSAYQVDSTGTHVQALAGTDVLADLWIGKSAGGSLYVRLNDDDDVYAVRGMLGNYFNKGFNDWRDKFFARLEPDSITKVTFHYPADSGFVAVKTDSAWTIGGEPADAAKIERYLGKLRSKSFTTFADDFAPAADPDAVIAFEMNTNPVLTVNAWKQDGEKWILESSQRQGVYFSGEGYSVDELLEREEELR